MHDLNHSTSLVHIVVSEESLARGYYCGIGDQTYEYFQQHVTASIPINELRQRYLIHQYLYKSRSNADAHNLTLVSGILFAICIAGTAIFTLS